MLRQMWERARSLFSPRVSEADLRRQVDELRLRAPVPVFWLLGKTQSGKTSIVRYLTGAERAEIGKGFQPCTRFSSRYLFPSEQAPLLTFLDTRGLDEPGYDAAEDVSAFDEQTHLVLVTVKVLDHAQENLLAQLRQVRAARPHRPVILVLTCLHEAYPQQQHVQPYPFAADGQVVPGAPPVAEDLLRSIAEQRRRFEGLVDRVVAIDLTPSEEGFADPDYGGEVLRQVLLDTLPAAQAQTLRTLEVVQKNLQDYFARQALPTILGFSSLAGTAGAVPIPFVDILAISAVQTSMVYELAKLYGQPLTTQRLGELASTLGVGLLTRQAGRTLIKFVPGLGSVVGSMAVGALAAASTFALGKAFCYYYSAVLEGHVPRPDDLRKYYREQLDLAEAAWKRLHPQGGQKENKP